MRQNNCKSPFTVCFLHYSIILLSVVFSVNSSMQADLWQSLKCILCPWKSRMARSHSNLSPKVKLTSNQHLQPLSFAACPSETSKVVPSHTLPAVCETVVVERRKERERFLIKAPQKLMLFFAICIWIVPVMCCWSLVSLWIARWLVSQPILLQWLCPALLDYTV